MNELRIDYQLVSQSCTHCRCEFEVSRGAVYIANRPEGLYLAGMHGCQDKTVFFAIALREDGEPGSQPICFMLKAWPTATEIQMVITNPEDSPWITETYMGSMLRREAALAHPLIKRVFEIADEIVMRPPVYLYLAD